ncbi:MAG: PRC-barrel domain-containing protein [Hyphomicrobium sp.]|jgi:sporulation protein YlmC with PRC-barrel domain
MKTRTTAASALALVSLMSCSALAQDSTTAQTPAAITTPNGGRMATDQTSASALLNKSVLNMANESIGDVNDVIIGGDGRVLSVIIGVGGFLGMGEKAVALPFDQLTISKDKNNELVVQTQATKASLQAAPQYVKPDGRT